MNQGEQAPRQIWSNEADFRHSPLRVLIIEDVPEDVELIVLAMEGARIEFTYETAATPEAFRQRLATQSFDVVLSDYRLPNFNGAQAFEVLKDSQQEIPFILITGSLGEEAAVECIRTGMTDYVLKDRLFRLPTVLERALQEFALRHQQKSAIAKIHQQAWREAIVNRIVQAMRKTLVLDEVLQITVDQLHEALQVTHCGIWQPDPSQSAALTIQYLSQGTPQRQKYLGKPCIFLSHYQDDLLHDRPVVIHDVERERLGSAWEGTPPLDFYSILLMPLVYHQTTLGGILLYHCDGPHTWTDNEVSLVRAIADQCALAIHQVKLYNQAQVELAERQRMEAQLRHHAFHDALTGLPNRAFLMNRLEYSLEMAQRRLQRQQQNSWLFAVLFLDLDRFKVVNDSLGHLAGDELLKIVSKQLQSCIRTGDMVARLGGDEFVLVLEEIKSVSDALEATQRVQQALKTPTILNGHEIVITASIGIALFSSQYNSPDELIRDADIAMYRAKSCGLGNYKIFDASMHACAIRQLKLESDLRRAIQRQELRVYYQPIFALDDQSIQGFEALVRWLHPDRGLIAPGEFIPIAEETGLIALIDLWVLREVGQQLQRWQQMFSLGSDFSISVNLSARQFSNPELIAHMEQILEDLEGVGAWLKIEITETVLIENPDKAAAILHQLREKHLRICLDDFGTGYSSLSYLHRFPIDVLKVDQSFIALLESNEEKSVIVSAIVNLALNLGLTVVAEGVETARQLAYLKSIKCHLAQGYYFAKPMETESAQMLLQPPSSL
jgi:diguanylate cyclase (GGDEF)-like protein